MSRYSRRFKTEEDKNWHTKTQFEAQRMVDNDFCDTINKEFGLKAKILTQNVIRITDGKKKLDLYETRYFKVEINERGDYNRNDSESLKKLITDYFNVPNQ